MNNLKKMMTLYALCAATCAAKAETISETEFMPVQKSGEIEGIRQGLVNGHLMVKSNGAIGSVATPYMFLNTNSTNFAQAGFTFKEMAEVNSLVIAKEDNQDVIYATRTNDTNNVYKFHVSPKTDLSGVGRVEKINAKDVQKVAILNGQVMAVGKDTLYNLSTHSDVVFNAGTTDTIYDDKDRPYTLNDKGHPVYQNKNGDTITYVEVVDKWFYDSVTKRIYCWQPYGNGLFYLDTTKLDTNTSIGSARSVNAPSNTVAVAVSSDGKTVFKTEDGSLVSDEKQSSVSKEEFKDAWTAGRYTYRVSDFATTKKRLSVERN